MDVLVENWFFIALLVACVGMHFFMHGHGHGHRHRGTGDADRPAGPGLEGGSPPGDPSPGHRR